ncbi:LysR family transcriptional regulator [Achromobacter sp. HZ01]|jgi:DNA-binding transcriptional LysR family regulator|uniref:LysR family transcriptional regulator n=1 Tax=Achromobacter pulmonis TaxID=1389932 RepID=A0A2N8KMA8_9BURK|nr:MULTISPECIES: LysR family transcriptional regulator [Achromobacter]MBO9332680.1 LysR family transcriptional regulator [Achromobacter xylosoxidans]PND34575.1 LysR family transcriptional regulator [Achromobacter pulmonis]RAP60238.1 LysR family transcriptional regulator [Achromobacter sp. HZ01]
MRYELTDLRLFLAIAEAGSLSGGANAVHLTASSASYRLKNLEFAMGVPLFKREARGMELTVEGAFVLKHVRSLLAGVERMHGEVSGFASGLKGSVKLFANSSSLNGFIVPSLGRFLSANPNVNILLEERSSTTIEAAIAGQEADIGIFAGRAQSAGVNATRYAVDELIIAAPLNHPVVDSSPVRFPAVLDLDFVCMNRSTSNFMFLRDMAKLAGKTPKVRIHVHTFDAALSMVEAGVGVSLVPRSVAAGALREGRIAAVGLREPWARRELTLVTAAGSPPSPFVEQVAGYLLDDPIVAATREQD